MDINPLAVSINNEFNLVVPEKISDEQLTGILAGYINNLIEKDFNALLNILYRVDVNEKKLRKILSENQDADAGKIIAGLIVERQREKLKWRSQYKKDDNIPDSEKW